MDNSDLFRYPWYYGKINRQEAEENLIDRGENEGCFLVRESQSRAGQLTISVLDWLDGECSVGHYLINQREGKYFFEDETKFDSVAELVEYYRENPDAICFVLKDPCPREIRLPDKDIDDYDLYEAATELPMGEEFVQERILSTGQISTAWKGHLKSCHSVSLVAKIANNNESAQHELRHEAQVLKFLNHENIVRLKGVVSTSPQFQIILHLAGDINLIGFLLNNSIFKISLMDQLNIAIQIASALRFCSRMRCIHRNIKAKSVIISTTDMKCKLAAFRNSRTADEYGYYHALAEEERQDAVHSSRIRWMSIEAAKHGRFSQASDVWSFAVLLTEIFTGGGLPYAGYLTCKVLEEVEKGFRCPRPQSCPKEIYDLMNSCWQESEGQRPTFESIKNSLAKYVDDKKEMLVKLQPPKPSQWSRYAPWKHGSVKQQRTTSVRDVLRSQASPLPPLPTSAYGYDN